MRKYKYKYTAEQIKIIKHYWKKRCKEYEKYIDTEIEIENKMVCALRRAGLNDTVEFWYNQYGECSGVGTACKYYPLLQSNKLEDK
jgi:hypothetical protein